MENQNNSTDSPATENNIEELKKRAEQGDKKAQYLLGKSYEEIGDWIGAFSWFEKSANQGCAEAQCKLSKYYMEGKGVQKDLGKALKWQRKATEQGFTWTENKEEESNIKPQANKKPDCNYNFHAIPRRYYYSESDFIDARADWEGAIDPELEDEDYQDDFTSKVVVDVYEEDGVRVPVIAEEQDLDYPEDRDDWDAEDYENQYASAEPDYDRYEYDGY